MTELTIDQALQRGVEAHKVGQVQEADRLYTAILKAQPKHPDANHNMGVLAAGLGKVEQALPFFKTALEANPATAQFWLSYIDTLIKLNKLASAKAVLDQARGKGAKGDGFDKLEQRLNEAHKELVVGCNLASEPQLKQPNILDTITLGQALKLAKTRAKEGSSKEAKRIYQGILTKFPANKRARDGLEALKTGLASRISKVQDPPQAQLKALMMVYNQGKLDIAVEHAQVLTRQYPEAFVVWNLMGAAAAQLGELDLAIFAFERVLAIQPDSTEAYNNMGNALKEQGKLEGSIEAYNKALAIKPDYIDAYYNMGNVLKEQGKLEGAIEAYNKALTIKPDYAEAYFNMGNALKEQGKLEGSIEAYNKALTIKPDYIDAYCNTGNALKEQGKLEGAIEAYNKALTIKPDYAEAYFNMGNALKEQGKLEKSLDAYNKALAIKPDFAQAHCNVGIVLKEQNKLEGAIEAYNKALAINPGYADAYYNMGIVLNGIVFNHPNAILQKTIVSLLDQKSFVSPRNIAPAAISLLKFEPKLKRHLEPYAMAEVKTNFLAVIKDLSALPLLLKLMTVCPLPDLDLEKLLRGLRKRIICSISDLTGSTEELKFQSALALQCFTNEYIYNQSEREDKAIADLEATLKQTLTDGKQPLPHYILCLASYKPLNKYDWSSSLHITKEIEDVFIRQVTEPKQESKFKSILPVLEDITDEVSSKVRNQYEASPYPRWVNLGLPSKPASISQVANKNKLKLFDNGIIEVQAPNVLIAGCGTGQHPLGTAVKFKDSKVLAIDLSLSSLSYAKRKTEELGINNIDYMQGDILDLGKLGGRFDIVESSGVLHHMDDPMAGWRVLTDCLKPGGLMKIGLYSELSRKHIVEIRQEINKAGAGSSDIAMKSLRKAVMASDKSHHKTLSSFSDFYSLSELRDLLFHVQEHRFTILEVKQCLAELGLKFCGFENGSIVMKFRLSNIGSGDPYDLDKWQIYEEANPRTFAGMYQFWCQKVS